MLRAILSAFRGTHRKESIRQLKSLGGKFFYRKFHGLLFPKQGLEGVFFATICALNICRFLFISLATLALLSFPSAYYVGLIIVAFLFGEFIPRIIGNRYPSPTVRIMAAPSSIFLFLALPLTLIFLKLSRRLTRIVYLDYMHEPEARAKQEILEMIHDRSIDAKLNPAEKQLLESAFSFRDRIVREVMVPRVDVFSLPAETTIRAAVKSAGEEGYSRIPVYRNTVDNMIGVLMYKDIVNAYGKYEENANDPKILDQTIEKLLKPPLYTPETKKISDLLQDFRREKVHIAIVVDEYGGTEGIVTIEDILEEIVGEIADEYDQESDLCISRPDGSWIVDAKMTIIDLEEETGINLPQEGDYDTVGGYLYHRAGEIPTKGFSILQENFRLEVLKTTERSVEKVRIWPMQEEETLV